MRRPRGCRALVRRTDGLGVSAVDPPTPRPLRPFPNREPRLREPLRRPRHAPGRDGREAGKGRSPSRCPSRGIRGRRGVSALVLLVPLAVLAARHLHPSQYGLPRAGSGAPPGTACRRGSRPAEAAYSRAQAQNGLDAALPAQPGRRRPPIPATGAGSPAKDYIAREKLFPGRFLQVSRDPFVKVKVRDSAVPSKNH
jgi:hypothetical protein